MKKKSYKRLPRTPRGSLILPSGEKITPAEQRALRSAVNSANRKIARKLKQRAVGQGSVKQVLSFMERELFGYETDFVLRKKSAKFNRFKTHKEFSNYLRSVRKIASGEYERRRGAIYKENYITALKEAFGSSARKVITKVRNMPLNDFINMVDNEELEEIGFVYYDPQSEKLARIESQLGV